MSLWASGGLAQRLTIAVAIFTVMLALGPASRTQKAQFICVNRDTGLPVVIAGAADRTAPEITGRHCTGDVAAATRQLALRYGYAPIMRGALVRLPVDND